MTAVRKREVLASPDFKVTNLKDPACYPHPVRHVEVAETHLSWVFLAGPYAYKLKKPATYNGVDLRTLDARRENSLQEVAVNRRLAPQLYLGVVPLALGDAPFPRLERDGEVIDWLIKMHRLPADRMLDQMLKSRTATRPDLEAVIRILAGFYRDAAPAITEPAAYATALCRTLELNRKSLADPVFELIDHRLEKILDDQWRFLEQHTEWLAARVEGGHVVEGHGDLRPEHICMTAPPVIYDCLEFNRDLRIADAADELSFLSLECERLGVPSADPIIWQCYSEVTGDTPPARLVYYYKSVRACVWARLALWRTRELGKAHWGRWIDRADTYLTLAAKYGSLLVEDRAVESTPSYLRA